VDPRNKSSHSPTILLPVIPAYTSIPHTTVWHVQNRSLLLTRSGYAHIWLVVAQVHPGCSLQEPVLNIIQVTYPTRGLPITPRYSLKPSVTLDTVSRPVTQILTPSCYKEIIHLPSCAIVPLIKIKPRTNPIPKAMLSMTYPETHPISRSTRNNKEGQTDTGFNLNACHYLK
jgi:hypothetical protein